MASWFVNRALTNFRDAVNQAYPGRDKGSDGTIGDSAHQSGSSDHNPDADGSVDAWDMDVEVNGRGNAYAADVEALKQVFQAHESSSYWIHNDQIARRADGWRRRPYSEFNSDPFRNKHQQHVHWNTRSAFENSNAPWHLEEDVEAKDVWNYMIDSPSLGGRAASEWIKAGEVAVRKADVLTAKVDAIAAAVANMSDDDELMTKLEEIDTEATDRAAAELARDADLKQLVEQWQSGDLTADEVVDQLAARLSND